MKAFVKNIDPGKVVSISRPVSDGVVALHALPQARQALPNCAGQQVSSDPAGRLFQPDG